MSITIVAICYCHGGSTGKTAIQIRTTPPHASEIDIRTIVYGRRTGLELSTSSGESYVLLSSSTEYIALPTKVEGRKEGPA